MTAQEVTFNKIVLSEQPEQNKSLQETLKIGMDALKIFPPFYVQSILGAAIHWLPPYREYSEFTVLNPWKPLATLNYLGDISIPAFSHAPNKWVRTFTPPLITNMFWRPSGYHQQMDPFDSETSFSREKWFFINGIGTNETLAQINSGLLSQMFRRPVTIINNSTNSIPLDVCQCLVGYQVKNDPSIDKPKTMTEPVGVAVVAIIEALVDPEVDNIVLINHSQGTIITGNVLRALGNALHTLEKLEANPGTVEIMELDILDQLALEKLPDVNHPYVDEAGGVLNYALKILTKLEVYTFANCSNDMAYLAYLEKESGEKIGLPYIENIANKNDIIARIGVLSPLREEGNEKSPITIDGPVFERKEDLTFMDTWGHLLNHCYLYAISDYLKDTENKSDPFPSQKDGDQRKPRLYGYFSGQRQRSYLL